MMSLAAALAAISRILDGLARRVAVFCVFMMTVVLAYQVFARYALAAPPSWTEELGRLFMVWGGFLGASAAFRARQDIVLTNVSDHFPIIWRWVARLARFAAVAVFCGTVLYHSPSFLVRGMNTDFFGLAGVPVVLATSAVPTFMMLVLIHALAALLVPQGPLNEPDESTATTISRRES